MYKIIFTFPNGQEAESNDSFVDMESIAKYFAVIGFDLKEGEFTDGETTARVHKIS
jgi:hypothetical protein